MKVAEPRKFPCQHCRAMLDEDEFAVVVGCVGFCSQTCRVNHYTERRYSIFEEKFNEAMRDAKFFELQVQMAKTELQKELRDAEAQGAVEFRNEARVFYRERDALRDENAKLKERVVKLESALNASKESEE